MTKKPIVSIVCHGALANITLDFRSKDDVDLAMVPKLIEEYEPVSYTHLVQIIATHSFEGNRSYQCPEALLMKRIDTAQFGMVNYFFPAKKAVE